VMPKGSTIKSGTLAQTEGPGKYCTVIGKHCIKESKIGERGTNLTIEESLQIISYLSNHTTPSRTQKYCDRLLKKYTRKNPLHVEEFNSHLKGLSSEI
jgi:hypothetical protein